MFVNEKSAGLATPDTEPVTVYEPTVELAVNTTEVARPEALVTAVVTPPAKVPLAPDPGAANVTVIPLSGLPTESFTNATNGEAKAVLITALCGDPELTVTDAGAPAVFVNEKLAGVLTPAVDAVTE